MLASQNYQDRGNYEYFYRATRDPNSVFVRGFLHVFVNSHLRAEWCRQNSVPFVPPVEQQAQLIETYPGYRLVPQEPTDVSVPEGYKLVPIHDQPPSVTESQN